MTSVTKVKRDGTVVVRRTGKSIGSVSPMGAGLWKARARDGTRQTITGRAQAVRWLVGKATGDPEAKDPR